MNFASPPSDTPVANFFDCQATLLRLVGNISGFVYRRRHDAHWTMECVSPGFRDVTGYDPHRFIGNASIAFGDLISRTDWKRVNERVRLAALQRQRTTIDYVIHTAHGAWEQVEDRLTPIVNAAGKVLAIEGIIDRARYHHTGCGIARTKAELVQIAGSCTSPSPN